ncbi:hypothetical protein KAI92_04855, partial [Candidatus Parcubacteria bacterium]|nr:hypothetical protein [Candidatus Parcubacteria bacterium]
YGDEDGGGVNAGQTYIILGKPRQFSSVNARHVKAGTSLSIGDNIFISDETITTDSQLYIDSNMVNVLGGLNTTGYVSIGTSSLLQTLSVQGTTGTDILNITLSDGSSIFHIDEIGNVGIGTTSLSNIFTVASTTTGQNLFVIDDAGQVGIGTSSPEAQVNIYTDLAASTSPSLLIQGEANASSSVLFKVVSNVNTTANAIFRIDADGTTHADGSYVSTGADYAEYYYTVDTDLESGEVVCVDVENNNAVKRCARMADGNVMGIVSTNPSIIGNNKDGFSDDDNYVIVGMLGQVPAKVSTENGPIRPGDSLTSASELGYIMRANPGDPTVGVALENLDVSVIASDSEAISLDMDTASTTGLPQSLSLLRNDKGVINVLISRRNKSLTVEAVESQITDRIVAMEIEDEVQILISQAVDDMNLDSEIQVIVDDQIALFGNRLTVEFDVLNGQLISLASGIDELADRVTTLENNHELLSLRMDSVENSRDAIHRILETDEDGNVVIGMMTINDDKDAMDDVSTGTVVSIVDITTIASTTAVAFVVNQGGFGDVADFQAKGVSIMNIDNDSKVTVVGEMLVDGRIMVCSGGVCGDALNDAVDETMGDMGVEGKMVAGAFESICDEGMIWVPGSSKYGTMPGFCVNSHKERINSVGGVTISLTTDDNVITNLSQGEAQLACVEKANGYHLLSENEWLTIAENIIRVSENDIDDTQDGLQLITAEATSSISLILSNGNVIHEIFGEIKEWTDMTITQAGLPEPVINIWQDYIQIENYNGLNIAPPYYYNSSNGIGGIMTGTATSTIDNLRGFVRGGFGVYSLDLSFSPTTATSTIGYRCAK